MVMGPNDSGKAQILKAIERALRNPGESQSLVDLYGPNGAMSEFADSLVDTLGRRRRPHRLKRRDIAERFARRTHTLTDGAAFNTAEPVPAQPEHPNKSPPEP